MRLRLLPHKYQLLTPIPDLAAAATLRSGSASRDFRAGLGPPRLALTRPLALSLLLLSQSICLFAAAAPPTPRSSSWIGAEGTAPRALAGPRRVTSARRRRRYCAALVLRGATAAKAVAPSPGRTRERGVAAAAVTSGAGERCTRPQAPRGREGGRAERGVGVRAGERSARAGRLRRPNKVCFDEKRLRFLFHVGRRVLLAPGFGRVMVLGSVRKARRTKAGRRAAAGENVRQRSRSRFAPLGPGAGRSLAARGGWAEAARGAPRSTVGKMSVILL